MYLVRMIDMIDGKMVSSYFECESKSEADAMMSFQKNLINQGHKRPVMATSWEAKEVEKVHNPSYFSED
jgi:hypothetical protein